MIDRLHRILAECDEDLPLEIVLGSNGQFTSSGVVVDYDANGNLLMTGCSTQTATRLTAGFEPHGDDWNH